MVDVRRMGIELTLDEVDRVLEKEGRSVKSLSPVLAKGRLTGT